MRFNELFLAACMLGILLHWPKVKSQDTTNSETVRFPEPEDLKSGVLGRGGEELYSAAFYQLR
jgi:hypothetical protein